MREAERSARVAGGAQGMGIGTVSRTIFAVALALVGACAGSRPTNLGVTDSRLAPCPSSPNCVSSDAIDEDHAIAPLALGDDRPDVWARVRAAVSELPRTRIVTATDDYLHAECATAVFGFVDDLELHRRSAESIVAVRSASRVGHSDFGVNRARVESLRAALADDGDS